MPAPRRDPEGLARHLESPLADRLARQRPGVRGLRLRARGGPGGTGFSSDTLLLDAVWSEAGPPPRERVERWVARLTPEGFTLFPRPDLPRQVRVLRALASTDVAVPAVVLAEDAAELLGAPFYVMEYVEGWTPADSPPYHADREGPLHRLPEAERGNPWWSGLEQMARLHRLDWRSLGLGFLPGADGDPVAWQLAEYEPFGLWGLDPARHELLGRALERLRAERPPPPAAPALCWGDARPGNQLFRGARCVAVLDWEMAHVGDPVHDLAWWLALDRCLCEGVGVPRLPGLPERSATVERWEEAVGRPARELAWYELLSLFQFSVIMARLVRRMKHYGVLPDDHAMETSNLASHVLERELASWEA